MRKETLFLIFLVFLILGCTIPNGSYTNENLTYNGLGVVSFTSDLYRFPANTITNVVLQLHNYGDNDATNVQSKLVGVQGAPDIKEQDSSTASAQLTKDNDIVFYWTLKFESSGVYTDVTYSVDAKTYYEYQSNATKEIRFRKSSGTSYVESGGGNTKSPLNVTLSSQSTVYLPSDTGNEFTVTIRIENVDNGYPTCRHVESGESGGLTGSGEYCDTAGTSEYESYRNYIKSIELYIPNTWSLKKPEEWSACGTLGNSNCFEYAPDFSSPENVDRRLYLSQGIRNVFSVGFIRGGTDITEEKLEPMKVVIRYTYVVPSESIDLTLEGSEQTY